MADNRDRGLTWERLCAKTLRGIGFVFAACSRQHNRERDTMQVDLCNENEEVNGRLPYNIQCKTSTKTLPYPKLLNEIRKCNGRERVNVIFHKQTINVNGKFQTRGEYAILELKDFYKMMDDLNSK